MARLSLQPSSPTPELVDALNGRNSANGWRAFFTGGPEAGNAHIDSICRRVLAVPRGPRWREAVSTALLSDWDAPLWETGHLPSTAVGALRAEARAAHKQLVPLWRRRTRHGRVISLDADPGGGISLHDLVAADLDLLTHTSSGVYEDARINTVLRALDPAERQVVFAYAETDGITWTEAAAACSAADAAALGERVRRKIKRLAVEQRRRAAQRISSSHRRFQHSALLPGLRGEAGRRSGSPGRDTWNRLRCPAQAEVCDQDLHHLPVVLSPPLTTGSSSVRESGLLPRAAVPWGFKGVGRVAATRVATPVTSFPGPGEDASWRGEDGPARITPPRRTVLPDAPEPRRDVSVRCVFCSGPLHPGQPNPSVLPGPPDRQAPRREEST